jgi:hypothetical protein
VNCSFILHSACKGYKEHEPDNGKAGLSMSNQHLKCGGKPWRSIALLLSVVLLAGLPAQALADGRDADHDRARQALAAGEVLPLRTILERVERDYPGQVIDVELEREHADSRERWVYEIKVLRSGGALVKLKVDARDGTILGQKSKAAKGVTDSHGVPGSEREPVLRRRSGEGN